MTSLSAALRIATSGMQTSQIALGTISHNLSNVNTAGYSRQTVQISQQSFNGVGEGSVLNAIQRNTDAFLETRLNQQISQASFAETKAVFFSSIEGAFSSPNSDGGLDKLMNRFFNELSNLSNFPDSSAQKRNVLQQATLLADTIQDTGSDLVDIQTRVNNKVNENLTTINSILENIHELSSEIANTQLGTVGAANTADLRDQRQQQINELAKFIPLSISESSSNGTVRIIAENGRQLIGDGSYTQLERTTGTPFSGIGVRSVLVSGGLAPNAVELDTSTLNSGSLKALVEIRDTEIPQLTAQLDEMVDTFTTEFNKVHSRGSSFPPQRTLTSGSTSGLSGVGADMFADLDANLAGDTFHITVTNASGDPVFTTVDTGLAVDGAGPITIPSVGTFSLTDLATLINNNVDVGVTSLGGGLGVTASATTDSDGNPVIQIQATDSSLKVVLSNASTSATDDPLGVLGMNNFFTGSTASTISVRTDIAADPELIATGRMRTDTGGLSSQDNQNILELAEFADTEVSFSSAGGLGAQTDSVAGYASQIVANLAVEIQDAEDRLEFTEALKFELSEQLSSISGVNMDEELAQMLIFQNSFQASARIISMVDELFDTLLSAV